MDTISRQAVLGYIDRVLTIGTGKKKSLDFVRKYVETLPSAHQEDCGECKHLGKWENEVEYGYPSPCTSCKRRVSDNYERRHNL